MAVTRFSIEGIKGESLLILVVTGCIQGEIVSWNLVKK